MIRLLLLLILLLAGLVAGPFLIGEKGYVLIAFNDWTIELTLVSLSLIILAAVIGFLTLEWLIKRGYAAVSGSRQWFGNITQRKQQAAFTQGLAALDAGDANSASKYLTKINHKQFSGISLLALAQAAYAKGEIHEAINAWQQALTHKDSCVPATLHLVRHHLANHQPNEAKRLISDLSEKQQKQGPVILASVEIQASLGQWHELKQSLKDNKKLINADNYDSWMRRASQGELAEIASKQGANELKAFWQSLPRGHRKDPAQQAAYIEQLIAQGMNQDAEKALVEYQKKGPEPLLLPLFKQLRLSNPAAAFKSLESWIKQQPENPELYSALGHLAYHSKDWQLADKALAKAIALNNNHDDLQLMAQIKEAQQQPQQALTLYKQLSNS